MNEDNSSLIKTMRKKKMSRKQILSESNQICISITPIPIDLSHETEFRLYNPYMVCTHLLLCTTK